MLAAKSFILQVLLATLCLLLHAPLLVSGQEDEWSGFVNSPEAMLDFSCPNNTAITGLASNFSRDALDREWEFLCGTGGGLAPIMATCSLQAAINDVQGEIAYSCPDGGYLGGFRSVFSATEFDRTWEPYCCVRPSVALISCQLPTSRYENDLRGNLNFTAPTDHVVVGIESFYFNRDRRWRYQVCQLEVSCGDPGVPSNGRRIGDQFLYRDEVMFECDDGYYMSSGSQERECLITGEWNGTQPICTECEVIPSCEQVLCTSPTDQVCMLCQSNNGPMLGQRAYTNTGTECQARCSWLGEFCYPGVCPSTPESCNCTDGFTGQSCLQVTDSPSLSSCVLLLGGADGDQVTTSCQPSNLTSPILTNIRPHLLQGMWEGLYTVPMPLPPRPAYISSDGFDVGVAISEIVTSLYRAANPVDIVSESSHVCDDATPTPDTPIPGVTPCTASATSASLANHTFLHGDTFQVEVYVAAGGFLDVTDLDTPSVSTRHYYTGTPTIGGATFILDFEPPSHCSLPPNLDCASGQPLLALSGEVVSTGNISITWGGWLDMPAGLAGYVLTVSQLQESQGTLTEGATIMYTNYNETGDIVYEEMTDLPQQGPYSIVLQAQDTTGNIRYSRRLVLFDNSSTLNIEPSLPLVVTSAVPQSNYMWQNSTSDPIVVSGRGHFYNTHLRANAWLAPVADNEATVDYDHPLTEGAFPRNGTPNAVGVVELYYDVFVDQEGGLSQESLTPPNTFRFTSSDISLGEVSIDTDLRDGDAVRVWFLAQDYNSQQINDSVLVFVDSSGAVLSDLGLMRNGVVGLALHGTDSFTDLVVEFDAADEHSGLFSLEWSIGTGPGYADVGNGNVAVGTVAMETCMRPACVCDSVGRCNVVHYSFSPQLSDLLLPLANHDAEYYITVMATNHAFITTQLSLVFTVDTTPPLPGVVLDGIPTEADIDYTNNGGTLGGWWKGFFDRESDVMFYQYVLAEECANTSVFMYPLPVDSVVMTTTLDLAIIPPQEEGTYFLTVVAWNTALSPSDPVCSDGVTVDETPPELEGVVIPGGVVQGGLVQDVSGEVWLISEDRSRKVVTGGEDNAVCISKATPTPDLSAYPISTTGMMVFADICTTTSSFDPAQLTLVTRDHTLNISWVVSDNVGVGLFYVGLIPAEDYSEAVEMDYQVLTGGLPHHSVTDPSILQDGNLFYLSVRAEDLALHSTTVTVGPVLVHLTPPLTNGSLQVQQQQGHLTVTWSEGSISEEEGAWPVTIHYAIGLSSYDDDILSFRPLPLTTPPPCSTMRCIAVDPTSEATPFISGKTYHFTLSATNRAGLSSFLTSDPYLYVSTTPSPGVVWEVDPQASVEVIAGSSYHDTDIDVLVEGVTLGVRWAGFAHDSADVQHSIGLGTMPGWDDVVPLMFLGGGVKKYVFHEVALLEGSTYYATVVAATGFSHSNSSSNGVLVLREGEAALRVASVYDGNSQVDIEYHTSSTQVEAQWFFPAHLHAHISHYMWAVLGEEAFLSMSASGSGSTNSDPDLTVIREYQNVGKDTLGVAFVEGLRADGSLYVNAVKACFATQCLPPVYSDGFRVAVAPSPGPIINAIYTPLLYDQLYGTSASGRLELVWEEFSDPQLAYYEWSIGTEDVESGGLLVQWQQVEWFENQLSLILNVTISLHYDNKVTLRGYNSAGLHTSVSTALEWNVGGKVVPQSSVPLPPLVVYDIHESQVTQDAAAKDWRDLVHQVDNSQDLDYVDSVSWLSGGWPDLRYTQYNYSISTQRSFQPCSNALACGNTFHNSATVSNLPLTDGQRYYFCVQALAEHAIHVTLTTPPVLEACSNGVTVDQSPPQGGCVKVVSSLRNGVMGGSSGNTNDLSELDRNCNTLNDTLFQVSTSDLYLVWEEFVDVESHGNAVHVSGVASYSYAIGTRPFGANTVNFTSVGVSTSAAVVGLSLRAGITYYATVLAVDFTGKSSYVVSHGVSIDTTSPIVEWVGLSGITQYQNGLQLEWNMVADDESDIVYVEYGLGTRPGSSDVTGWRETDLHHNTGIQLDTTDLSLSQGQIVFSSLKVRNAAGLVTTTSSLGYLLDSSPPDVGRVFDGPPSSDGDVDYWTDSAMLQAHWAGFSDPHSDVVEYLWAIGSCPSCVDVQPFVTVGLKQAGVRPDLALSAGVRYYVHVRACNALQLCSQQTSNGATLDATPPIRGRVLDGLEEGDVQFQSSPLLITAHWDAYQDAQSHIRNYIYSVGFSPNGSDVIQPTTLPADHTSFLHLLTTPLPSGSKVYTTVVGYNRAGFSRTSISNGVMIDSISPTYVSQPIITTDWTGSRFNTSQFSSSAMRVTWNFTDNLYSVHQYFVSFMSDSRSKVPIPQTLVTADSMAVSMLQLSDGNGYQVLVVGCDLAGLCVSSSTGSVLVDSSPPIDGYFAVASGSVANLTSARTVPGGMTWRNIPDTATALLNLAFLGFSDVHSQVVEYWATVGSKFSGADLATATLLTPTLANGSDEIHLASVSLGRLVMVSETLYISLWAVNGAGLSSHVVQASFRAGPGEDSGSLVLLRSPACAIVSCVGHCSCAARGQLCTVLSSLPCQAPPTTPSLDRTVHVYNVAPQVLPQSLSSDGPLFSSISDKLYGRWELANPLSQEVQLLEWSVGVQDDPMVPGAGLIDIVNGIVWRDAGPAMSAVFTVSERYPLVEGGVYVFYVRAWYSADEFSVFSSSGVVIDTRGPVPINGRRIRETTPSLTSMDLDFSSSTSSLSFAVDGVFSTALSGNYSNFELGVGNIPGSDNVYPLTSLPAGQVSPVVSGLPLEEGVAYYAMVRATNDLGVSMVSLSDGVVVDTTPADVGVVLSGRGKGYIATLAQTDTDVLSMRWYGFSDVESNIQHYLVAVSNTTSVPSSSLYINVGIVQQTSLRGLSLVPGQTYYAFVISVNRAGLASPAVVSRGVVIQDLRPVGRVCQERSAELLVNPSFENSTTSGVPCLPPDITMATHGWDLNASSIAIATYPLNPAADGCYSVQVMGSIAQYFPTNPGHTYLLSFSYRYHSLAHSTAVRVQVSGVQRLISRPPGPPASTWHRAHVNFVPTDAISLLTLSSALSDSPVSIDHVTITSCSQYDQLVSTELSATWPAVIHTNQQVISSPKVALSAHWDVVDMVGGIREYWWAIGTVPGGEQLQQYQSTGVTPEGISKEVLVSHGQYVHLSVVAWNNAGRQLKVHSSPYLVDLTPPPPRVVDGVGETDVDYQSSGVVGVNWTGIVDEESGLEQCAWAVGTGPGLSDIQNYLPILITDENAMTSDLSDSVLHGTTVYSTVVCSNEGALTTSATTDGLTILTQQPHGEEAVVRVASPTFTQYRPQQGYLPTAAITIYWDGFVEPAKTALEYEVRVLEGGVEQTNWTSLSSAKMLTLSELELAENMTHQIQIRASNLADMKSEPINMNFAIVSSPPLDTGSAINASWSHDSVLSLDWSGKFSSPTPLYYEISIGTQIGSGRVRKWVELSVAQSSYNGSLQLVTNEDYFVAVTAISSSGLHTTAIELLSGLPLLGT